MPNLPVLFGIFIVKSISISAFSLTFIALFKVSFNTIPEALCSTAFPFTFILDTSIYPGLKPSGKHFEGLPIEGTVSKVL